jgi:hypothetical protein
LETLIFRLFLTFTRVLNAKYFIRRDFLEVPLGHNPSYTWRNLWSTQHLLTLSHRWKVGNGAKINVWNMPCVRNLPSLKLSITPPPSYEDLTVSHWMHPGSLSWDHTLVRSMFNQSDATAILATHLYSWPIEDSRVRKATIDVSYTVKSVYRNALISSIIPSLRIILIGSSYRISKSHLSFTFSYGKQSINACQRE